MSIKNKRIEKKLSQGELAKFLGVHPSTVVKWESGVAYPRVEVLIKLSDYFGCTIDELVRGENPKRL
ncbi:MAG: helix-turn-helix transcriptional regulator [Ruminococcaceae bacterium]|nr:helix-turn-helix transcriptional regulator [Oscillospiraceae bacterium]